MVWRLIYAFWYFPMYVTYAKILARVRYHVQGFYGNCRTLAEAYSEPYQISKMELLAKIVND